MPIPGRTDGFTDTGTGLLAVTESSKNGYWSVIFVVSFEILVTVLDFGGDNRKKKPRLRLLLAGHHMLAECLRFEVNAARAGNDRLFLPQPKPSAPALLPALFRVFQSLRH